MILVGLTGGIGSGKSSVARLLAERGAVVIDADQVAREVVAPGSPGLRAVEDEFGAAVIGSDGSLDRAALAAVVFQDPLRRSRLDGILHPLVRTRMAELTARSAAAPVVVHDVPLLVETGQWRAYPVVIVVDAPEEVRVRRLVQTRGMDERDARARVRSQCTREERLAVATYVIDNGGSPTQLGAAVDRLWGDLSGAAAVP